MTRSYATHYLGADSMSPEGTGVGARLELSSIWSIGSGRDSRNNNNQRQRSQTWSMEITDISVLPIMHERRCGQGEG